VLVVVVVELQVHRVGQRRLPPEPEPPGRGRESEIRMQTYRLVVGPDGQVRIPDGKPGQVVTVQVEPAPTAPPEREMLTLANARTPEERAEVIAIINENAEKLRELMKDAPPFAIEDLYGEDGLPA
jgi:hypothetical protein